MLAFPVKLPQPEGYQGLLLSHRDGGSTETGQVQVQNGWLRRTALPTGDTVVTRWPTWRSMRAGVSEVAGFVQLTRAYAAPPGIRSGS